MPLDWTRVTPRLSLGRYTIPTAAGYLVESCDPLTAVLTDTIDMGAALYALQRQVAR